MILAKKMCFGGLELAHTKVLPEIVAVQKMEKP